MGCVLKSIYKLNLNCFIVFRNLELFNGMVHEHFLLLFDVLLLKNALLDVVKIIIVLLGIADFIMICFYFVCLLVRSHVKILESDIVGDHSFSKILQEVQFSLMQIN